MVNLDENSAILAIKDLFSHVEVYVVTWFEDQHDMYV